jgi:Putative Ig domain
VSRAGAGPVRLPPLERTDTAPMTARANASPAGLDPANFQSAYELPSSTGGGGQTVAVVDAYDDPNIESDLAVYRDKYWLPSCTTANGCFRKVNQNGLTAPLPAGNYGWAAEESLDVEMVSAACPNCHILLVEANSSGPDLYTAVKTAVNLQIRARDSAGSALTYRATGLPVGLAITATSGSISGTPTMTGTSSVTVSAADASGASASTAFSWTITAGATPPVVTVTNPGARTSVVGTAASLQIKAVGSIASTLTYKATSLPGGLTINPGTGLISGTPTVTGSTRRRWR